MVRSAQVLALLLVCLLAAGAPEAHGEAFAGAGVGGTGAVAGASAGGFSNLFPIFFPSATPCSNLVNIDPWAPAATIPAPTPGLLTYVNNVAVFSDVSLCPGGNIIFHWMGNHNVFQLASGVCPSAATPAADQKQLVPAAVDGKATLTFPTSGTYWLTSTVGQDCSQGQLVKVVVPINAGLPFAVVPAVTPLPLRSAVAPLPLLAPPRAEPSLPPMPAPARAAPAVPAPGGPSAAALGPPGGTSTSTSQNVGAAASGPPGTANTATGNGTAVSSAGDPAALNSALGLLNSISGRRLQQTRPGNTAASINSPGLNNCTEQRVTPNGLGGGALSRGACNKTATSLAPTGDVAAAGNGGTALTGPGQSFSHTPGGRRMLQRRNEEVH